MDGLLNCECCYAGFTIGRVKDIESVSKLIEISDETASLLQELVDSGEFPDITTAIDRAAELLEPSRLDAEFEAGLQQAWDEVERGESVPFTAELNDAIFAEALAEYRSKQKSPIGSVE